MNLMRDYFRVYFSCGLLIVINHYNAAEKRQDEARRHVHYGHRGKSVQPAESGRRVLGEDHQEANQAKTPGSDRKLTRVV